MGMPTFIVVGTQKAATTWLSECLSEHPDVFVPDMKEVHFYCPANDCRFSRRQKGEQWYLNLFPDKGYRAAGELTTDYMFYPSVAQDLFELNPGAKIIFLLRDPVDRAYSAYWMRRRHKTNLPPFREMLKQTNGYIERGLYHRQIVPYIELFGREQVRIYIYEEALADKISFISDIFAFLGVDPDYRPLALKTNVGGSRVLPKGMGFLLYKVISPVINLPGILPIWRFLRRNTNLHDWVLDRFTPANGQSADYPAMSPDDRAFLADIFLKENQRLFELLGHDIPQWTK